MSIQKKSFEAIARPKVLIGMGLIILIIFLAIGKPGLDKYYEKLYEERTRARIAELENRHEMELADLAGRLAMSEESRKRLQGLVFEGKRKIEGYEAEITELSAPGSLQELIERFRGLGYAADICNSAI